MILQELSLKNYFKEIGWEKIKYPDRGLYLGKWLDVHKECPMDNLPLEITGTYKPNKYGYWRRYYKCPAHGTILEIAPGAEGLHEDMLRLIRRLNPNKFNLAGIDDGFRIPIGGSSTTTPTRTSSIFKKFKLRDKGTFVGLLKYRLRVIGFRTKGLGNTFNESTKVAVKKAQESFGLPITGVVDSVTSKRLLQKVQEIKTNGTLYGKWLNRKKRRQNYL